MENNEAAKNIASEIDSIIASATPARAESLRIALGAMQNTLNFNTANCLAVLKRLADTTRLARVDTICLPFGRYDHLSRGKGWARLGRGDKARWGEKDEKGWRVGPGPGRWTVGSTDGFSRKEQVDWKVEHVMVANHTWTIAN